MSGFNRKTYDNSYLFNKEADMHHKIITEFIIKADRIDKSSDAFRGVIEDIKRMQNSNILLSILSLNDVVLCVNKNEISRAFKVFEAKDLRTDRKPRVFIDVTNLIILKDGYFTCKKIDVFCTYLYNALGYLLYSKEPIKLIGNSNITIAGTECFVSLFNYIPDYLRIIGYSQNKEKISYLAGLYFIYHMMGKDLDMYSKNVAAKAAGLSTSDTKAFDLYYDPEKDFKDISTFVDLIAGTFKLKEFTTESFIHKWTYLFGNGTYFATELFTSFMTLITSSYCGSYIVNQKQIERCCGSSMVKFCLALNQIAVDVFDKRGYMEQSELDSLVGRDKNTVALKESFLKKMPDDAKLTNEALKDPSKARAAAKKMVEYFKSSNKEQKISKYALVCAAACCGGMQDFAINGRDTYKPGVLEAILKEFKPYIDDKNKRLIRTNWIDPYIGLFSEAPKKEDKYPNMNKQNCSKCVVELRKCLGYI